MQVHEIDEHIEAPAPEIDTSAFNAQELKLFNICAAYQKVRPVIKFVRGMLFWKPKWQAVIDTFLTVTDGICPKEP